MLRNDCSKIKLELNFWPLQDNSMILLDDYLRNESFQLSNNPSIFIHDLLQRELVA